MDESVRTSGTLPAPALFASDRRLGRVAPAFIAVSIVSAIATFLILANLTPILPTHQVVVTALAVDGILALLLIAIVLAEAFRLWRGRRRGTVAARLQTRIVTLFSIVAGIPALIVVAVALVILNRGLDQLFNQAIQRLVTNAGNIGQFYVAEQTQQVRLEVQTMAVDLERAKTIFDGDRAQFKLILTAQAQYRGLPVVQLIKGDRTLVERADINVQGEYPIPPPEVFEDAKSGNDLVMSIAPNFESVQTLIRLKTYDDLYLFTVRPLNPGVVQSLRATRAGEIEYRGMEERRGGVQLALGLMFLLITLIMLFSAAWVGLAFANRLVNPIRRLISAADQVAAGNLNVQVAIRRSEGDLANLGDTFNKMTEQLKSQRDDLVGAHDQIDRRARFTEAMLAGVGVGVIGVDVEGVVTLMNRPAEALTGMSEEDAKGRRLAEIVPEIAPLIEEAESLAARMLQSEVNLDRDGKRRTLTVRIATERASARDHGHVVTLDDITDLQQAQRMSAWSDVARRIAHEIKNPLTPIQLSAERLKRRYGKVIGEDRDVFDQCTDTIIRQVGDIGRMVDEFSAFARMPKAVIETHDVVEIVRQVAFLMRVGNPEIEIGFEQPAGPVEARFDARLISQALTNVVKNATEAIAAVPEAERGQGTIALAIEEGPGKVTVVVTDNGVGLPKADRQRLLEPYVTTREKGTGLGLAIVKKIMEDHGGGLALSDAPAVAAGGRGASVRLTIARDGGEVLPAAASRVATVT